MATSNTAWGCLASAADEAEHRRQALADPGSYHGNIAAAELHWHLAEAAGWVCLDPDAQSWAGFSTLNGQPLEALPESSWRPWEQAFDDQDAPFYRWFVGAQTNACFNEIDRHLLAGRGRDTAIVFEGDRWDPSLNAGGGGPVQQQNISYRQLLRETVIRAGVLRQLGLKQGDRIALNLPNIPEQIYYTEAAKRLGIIYTPVFGGFSAKTLSDRIYDAGATVVITADGGYRNAEVVPFKEAYTDPALDNYIPLATGLETLREVLHQSALTAEQCAPIEEQVAAALQGEITLERSDIMRELGQALAAQSQLEATVLAAVRTQVARRLAAVKHIVRSVVVVRYTGQDVVVQDRDQWSTDLVQKAQAQALAAIQSAREWADCAALEELDDRQYWELLASHQPALPVPADTPLFIIYTSGSTGKPKGVVHTHGGWLAGVSHTMRMVFGAQSNDCLYVIADPGWITGQSYLIAAPLALGLTTVIAEGSPLFPHAGRFASIIQRHGVTIFKAGSTFLKAVMTDPASRADLRRYSMASLKVATFCAEPVSPAVQHFAMHEVCPRYINSYWATEHGGMVFSCPWGDHKELAADAKTWALPWIDAQVRVATEQNDSGHALQWRLAEEGEKGELVIQQPYPYLARTIWGDAENLHSAQWKGDLQRFRQVYFQRWSGGWAYTQGDYARRHADGGFTLHGRSDDVINVSGHRLGTEEIEGAILRDKVLRTDSPLGNAVVVGAPHAEKGETPVAFVIPAPASRIGDDDLERLKGLVRDEKGVTAVPSDFLVVSGFPETRSGKYMRRTLRAILLDQPLGDLSTLRNPEIVEEIRTVVDSWRNLGQLGEVRNIVQTHRYLRWETHRLSATSSVALIWINHPPVNALNERALDELNTVLQHIRGNAEIQGLVISGAGRAFVAGADVKELLEVGEAGDMDSARTPPNAAQTAFASLENMPIPVLAAVNGPALGGGCELALACAYLVADRHAQFGQPEINLNLLPGYGGTQRLPRRLQARRGDQGLRDAAALILSGRALSASEAMDIGLVDEVIADEAQNPVATAVQRIRDYLAGSGPLVAAMQQRHSYLEQREQALGWQAQWLNEAPLSGLLKQLDGSGRQASKTRILQALQTGADAGQSVGLQLEAQLFAEAICDPYSGPKGIRAFLEKRSAPLPLKPGRLVNPVDSATEQKLLGEGQLLPLAASFYPGVTPIPAWQYGMGVRKDPRTGAPLHGNPQQAEKLLVFPTPQPGPNEALVYVLASEVNYNDIWAITGIPVSPFDNRDADVQVTGSGGVALIAALGSELVREGRLSVGQLVTIYSGQSELLSPDQGLDPMAADFHIQGYEINDGSHAQFLVVQGPQLQPKLASLTLEEAGSYALTQGTIHRALYRTLNIEPGRRLFVEGAATGTGLECLRAARQSGLDVVGMVSSPSRAQRVREHGGKPVNRCDERWRQAFVPVPDDPAQWAAWEQAGTDFVQEVQAQAGGAVNYVVSHAGERAFGRSFQCLGSGGVLTFYGASSGYRFSFMGKPGALSAEQILQRAGLRAGQALLVRYGVGASDGIVDEVAIQAIEVGLQRGARVAVLSDSLSQREFVNSLGFRAPFAGVVSIEQLQRRYGEDFDPPGPLAPMPDPFRESAAFKESVRQFSDRTLKPIGSAIAPLLRNTLDRRGLPDVIFARSGQDELALATSLVKPHLGRVVYAEDLQGQRLSFYAPQVWMRQRCIIMPTAEIRGTHLNSAREFAEVQERIASGMLDVVPPTPVPLAEIAQAHQAMWDNAHAGANYVAVHALPRLGLKTLDELYRAWALRDAQAQGIEWEKIDTGSAGTLR